MGAKDLRPNAELEPALAAFAQAYIRRIPEEHVARFSDDEVFAELRSVFEFAAESTDGGARVRVFNPAVDVHGFAHGVAVVDVVVDDSPFLVDSVRSAIEASGHKVTLDAHAVIGTERDDEGCLVDVGDARGSSHRESIQHYALERSLDDQESQKLESRIQSVLSDLKQAVSDFEPMQGAVDRMIEIARRGSGRYDESEVSEAVEFLQWLKDFNFVFLGYREYELDRGEKADTVRIVPDSGLGILREVKPEDENGIVITNSRGWTISWVTVPLTALLALSMGVAGALVGDRIHRRATRMAHQG